MTVATLTKEEKRYLEKRNESDNKRALEERSGGLCEICYRAYDLVVHHIWGRGDPWKSWPAEIREEWPHIPLNTIVICMGAHGAGDPSGRVHKALEHNAGPLGTWLEKKHGETVFREKTYREWYAGAGPWQEA